ncbi:hypothetical protein ES708_05898 [subsurface metagenome]
MYIKVATVKIKLKGKREKKVYRYVRVVTREYSFKTSRYEEKVIATLGPLYLVRMNAGTLIHGLSNLPGQ